jgi:hypothetical protein
MYRPANQPNRVLSPAGGELIGRLQVADSLPLRIIPTFGTGGTAVEHHEGPRAVVDIYRLP